jgi:hypothetical protein
MSRTQRELKALRQQQRAEAAARQRARDRRNLMITGGILGVVALAILVVAVALNQHDNAQNASRLTYQPVSGTIGTPVPDEGRNHVDVSTQPTYQHYPPASGPHYNAQGVAPVAWGTVAPQNQPLLEGQYIHNLEHGGIVILYNCPSGDGCTTLVNQLSNYVKNLCPLDPQFNEPKMIMTPYSKGMEKKIALVAWDYIEFLDSYNQNAITQFYDNHVDKAPEQIA